MEVTDHTINKDSKRKWEYLSLSSLFNLRFLLTLAFSSDVVSFNQERRGGGGGGGGV